MLAWIQSHAPLIALFAIFGAGLFVIPFARQKTLAMKSFRDAQDSVAARAALDVVRASMATLVARSERVVRDLKDPSKAGTWSPAVDGPRFLHAVVDDFWKLGSKSWLRFCALERLDVESATKLLETIAEEQLLLLRDGPPKPSVGAGATPAELAALVAEILRDPTAGLPRRPLAVTLGDEVVLPRETVAPPEPIAPARFDATQTLTLDVTDQVREAARRRGEGGNARVVVLLLIVAAIGLAALVGLHR